MVVSIDLAQFQGRAERPFLAIWIEDKDKFPIRTLTVLYRDREARYLASFASGIAPIGCARWPRGPTSSARSRAPPARPAITRSGGT